MKDFAVFGSISHIYGKLHPEAVDSLTRTNNQAFTFFEGRSPKQALPPLAICCGKLCRGSKRCTLSSIHNYGGS
jgi:hypothetical protein